MLQATRASRTEKEVEDEFKQLAADKKASAKAATAAPRAAKKVPEYESLDTEAGEGFGFAREKSKNLLLNSQTLERETSAMLIPPTDGTQETEGTMTSRRNLITIK